MKKNLNSFNSKKIVLLFTLIVLGLLGNSYPIPLFFGVDFIFGSVFSVLILMLVSRTWAIVAALLISSYTYVLWGHYFAIVVFTLEIVFLSLICKNNHKNNILYLDLFYWIVIGGPLISFFYGKLLGVDTTLIDLIVLKQLLNGIVNVIIALILYYTLGSKLFRTSLTVTYQQLVNIVLVGFLIFTSLSILVINNKDFFEHLKDEITSDFKSIGEIVSKNSNNHEKMFVINGIKVFITGSREDVKSNELHTKDNGNVVPVDEGGEIYYWFDPDEMTKIKRWEHSYIIYEVHTGEKIIYLEEPFYSYFSKIQKKAIESMWIVVVVVFIGLFAAYIISRYLARPINKITQLTSSLTTKIKAQEELVWPTSDIEEIKQLYKNFQEMSEEQKKLFFTLDSEVTKKTEELNKLNASLEETIISEIEKNYEKDRLLLLKSKQAAMGEMIGNIAHQWRQPISSISMMVQNLTLAFEFGKLDQKLMDEKSQKITEQIEYMSKTIDDFRGFFKPDKSKANFLLSEKIEETISLVYDSFRHKNINILKSLSIQGEYYGFATEFTQVLLILLQNAKDAILSSNTKLFDITVSLLEDDNFYYVDVSDSGGGISEEIIDKIFQPYFTTKGIETGTGIGLYTARTIVESHMNGSLYFENIDNGVKFTIRLNKSENKN